MKRQAQYIVVVLVFAASLVFGQTSLDPQSNSKAQKGMREFYSPKHAKTTKRKKTNVKHTARFEFYKRVELAAKDKQRILKKLSKPQYSNPAYFGHKRKPKKRPPHRMRYCQECHIRH